MTVSFRAKLIASHTAVALAVGGIALLVVEFAISSRMESQVDTRLQAQGNAVATWLERAGHPNRLAKRLAAVVGARVTIIDADGEAVGDARIDGTSPQAPGNAQAATELRAARAQGVGKATRQFEDELVRYVAVDGPNDYLVRLGLPIDEIEETKSSLRKQLGLAGIAALIGAFGLAALVAAALTRRLRETAELAHQVSSGQIELADLGEDARPLPSRRDEVGLLAHSIISAANELHTSDTRRREFLANIAHEIRTPITSIRGYAETLTSSSPDAQTQQEFLQTIHRNAIRISELVDDLLELESLDAGKSRSLTGQRVPLIPVARQVKSTVAARAREQNARIELAIDDTLAANGDAFAIERILLNLVDNALNYGGRDIVIDIIGRNVDASNVQLRVRDDGPGISDDDRERIFDRFYRGARAASTQTQNHAGSGLGLAIAFELAEAMKGTLTLEQPLTSGAEFVLTLPRHTD